MSEKLEFQNIVVTTIDTIRYRFLFDLLVTHGKHVLFGGPTGTGKTVYIKQALDEQDKSKFQNVQSSFSAQTSANQIQDIIDSKLDKRRKGVFGPPIGKRAVIFIDDLNMPELEEYGAQPPIELLRQFMDHEGWYDRGPSSRCESSSTCSSRRRWVRRAAAETQSPRGFFATSTSSLCASSTTLPSRVYGAIVDWWGHRGNLPLEVVAKTPNLVKATLEIYNTIRKLNFSRRRPRATTRTTCAT